MGKGNSWLYIGSIALVIAAIAVTAIIDRSKSGQEDIRAKAGVTTGQAATAIVSSVNQSAGTLSVTNFVIGGNGTSTGATQVWTIQLPSTSNTASLGEGTRVTMKLDPKTVNIGTRTATALEVTTR
ncbi:hypothetical protein A2875_04400 [Candidatus Gottesmanbacteria bacterium RIFCSPHIGHO2_01_FULL_46_14]|uniref:Uncharacterized protein n=3 Tax=Candidatus Gottesmaniibacteriota TaxID=1752720 RepID=A0A1F5ZJI2_9BACT|nr:MAG: hypothetical protein UY08_C0004G0024 [Candidatus Gottesmanbacteria bacterium GW2011_GWA1_47_8]OGG12485.1 MAG: hypothetical protein A2875_04400 [Candidatus Gottesmanbacteria bacterium RIFCSPHIGHO2_01_FULL_46_14]OGG29653.1 MAG: hypothetical protein A2971_01275 [Candidatus Gottesmanbacteria bacterium RIFCSPLOWO2_01_FULL_46_21]